MLRTRTSLRLRMILDAALLPLVVACAGPGIAPVERPAPAVLLHSVIPLPTDIRLSETERFALDSTTVITVQPGNADLARIAGYLSALIGPSPQAAPRVMEALEPRAGSIHLTLHAGEPDDEGYDLTIMPSGILLTAPAPAGVFQGVQTLRQLLPPAVEYTAALRVPLGVPTGRIVDRPRFAWRGAMLDVSRHFFGVQDVKRYIDLMAMYKLNRLHLHLSDDQGWRIEIRSWPRLTEHGGSTQVGGGPGGFYTQEEYAEIVAYAADRFIVVVPEIDMPGHTNAALASYPELNCDGAAPPLYTGIQVGFSALCAEREITYTFVDDVVREVAALTPGPYFHIGGDEVEELTEEQYRAFIERVEGIVRSHGKTMVGWTEIAPASLHPTTLVQHWRPAERWEARVRGAVERGGRVVMSPANRVYLDMKYDSATVPGLAWAGLIDVRDSYQWDPATVIEGVGETSVVGVEAPLWSETLGTIRDVEYMAFPRLASVAEVGWSAAAARDWENFRLRLGAQGPRWTALGINFYRSPQVPWSDR
jgi:hexosaminidase